MAGGEVEEQRFRAASSAVRIRALAPVVGLHPTRKLTILNSILSVKIRVNPWPEFHFTSKFTAVPAATFCPAPGVCDTTMLAGEGWAGVSGTAAAGFD